MKQPRVTYKLGLTCCLCSQPVPDVSVEPDVCSAHRILAGRILLNLQPGRAEVVELTHRVNRRGRWTYAGRAARDGRRIIWEDS